jgi:hypothetical protein
MGLKAGNFNAEFMQPAGLDREYSLKDYMIDAPWNHINSSLLFSSSKGTIFAAGSMNKYIPG